MHIHRDSVSIFGAHASALGSELGELIGRRIEELAEYAEADLAALINILVLEPSDDLATVNAELGFALLSRQCDAIESHPAWFELTLVLSDDGFGVVIYVPKQKESDPGLLAYCMNQMRAHW